MSTTRLLDIKQLSAELPMPVRSIQTLKRRKKIPYLAIGHRTVRFDLEKVRREFAGESPQPPEKTPVPLPVEVC